jgi:hypothetical protein
MIEVSIPNGVASVELFDLGEAPDSLTDHGTRGRWVLFFRYPDGRAEAGPVFTLYQVADELARGHDRVTPDDAIDLFGRVLQADTRVSVRGELRGVPIAVWHLGGT